VAVTGEEIRRRLTEFAEKWSVYAGSERAEAQTFLNQLFACYGTVREDVARFEDPQHGRFLDLIWDRVCIIEMKRPSEAGRLVDHRTQAFDYWRGSADAAKNRPAPRYVARRTSSGRIPVFSASTGNDRDRVADLRHQVRCRPAQAKLIPPNNLASRLGLPQMTPMKRVCCVALLSALAAGASTGSAAAALQPVRSLSDLTPAPPANAPATYLAPIKAQVCKPPARARPKKVGAAKALAAGRQLLAKKGGRRAVAKALANRSLGAPATAESVALAAIGAGKPGAALAALLAALQKHPHDANLLASASALMTEVGKPLAGLALADAALKSHPSAKGPMGISIAAIALNNRGLALLALRRYGDAIAPLRQAIAKAPLLAEARRNLTVAYLCSGQDAKAVTAYSDAVHRNAGVTEVSTDTGATSTGSRQPKADAVLDLSHGEKGSLPALKVPANPRDGLKSADSLDSLFQRRNQEAYDLLSQQSARALQTGVASGPELLRIVNIESLYVNWMNQRPDLAAQRAQMIADEQQMDAMFNDTWLNKVPAIASDCGQKKTAAETQQCYQGPCRSAIDAAHNQWLPVATDGDAVGHQWAAGLYEYGTAVAANLANPAAHDTVVLLTRAEIWDAYSTYVLQRVASWAQAEKDYSECIESTGTDQSETAPGDEPAGLACPPQLDALNLSINLGVIKLAVKCESISASTGLPGVVAPFGNVSYAFGSGQTTAFVGLKTGISDLPGFDVGAKGGFYMTWDAHGNATDCGLRATASAGTAVPFDLGPSASGKLQYSLAGTLL
jgi:tetratricopeptide (TPR) repeat protein